MLEQAVTECLPKNKIDTRACLVVHAHGVGKQALRNATAAPAEQSFGTATHHVSGHGSSRTSESDRRTRKETARKNVMLHAAVFGEWEKRD